MQRAHFYAATLAMLTSVSVASLAHAVDRVVPTNYNTIQLAIDAATSGVDRVVISSPSGGPYASFTLDRAVEVRSTSDSTIVVDAGAASYAARITASGGVIRGLTLKGGSTKVLDVGPGTVDDCIIENVNTLLYDFAVVMGSSGGTLLNSTINRNSSAKCIEITGSGCEVSGCTIDARTAIQPGHPSAAVISAGGVTVEDNTLLLSGSGWGINPPPI